MESFYFTLFGNIRKKWLDMAAQCTCTLIVCSKSIKKNIYIYIYFKKINKKKIKREGGEWGVASESVMS